VDKKEKFEARYSDLVSWVSDELAHRLAKKLNDSEVSNLLVAFRSIVIRTQSATINDVNKREQS